MKVTHRAKKRLGDLYGYANLGPEEAGSWASTLELPADEVAFGVYRNEPICQIELIVVTTRGIHLKKKNVYEFISYRDIQSTGSPTKEPEDRVILLALSDGTEVALPITGGKGRFKDVFGFLHFLMRAPGDQPN